MYSRGALFVFVAACTQAAPTLSPPDASIDVVVGGPFVQLAPVTTTAIVAIGSYTDVLFDAQDGATVALLGLPDGVTQDPMTQASGHSSIRVHASLVAPTSESKIDLHAQAKGFADSDVAISLAVESDGAPDSTFGTNGALSLVWPGANPRAIAAFAGRVFVATTITTSPEVAAVRLADDGSFDKTFGANGFAVGAVASSTDADAIAIAQDGTIAIASGVRTDGGPESPAGFVLFDANGGALSPIATPDTAPATWSKSALVGFGPHILESFPSAITTALPGSFAPQELAVRSDGSILALGPAVTRRFVPQNDGSFALDLSFAASVGGTAIAVDGQDRAYVLGASGSMTRIDALGQIDATFGTNGTRALPFAGSMLVPNGGSSFIVVGITTIAKTTDSTIWVWRSDLDGNADATFGSSGVTMTPVINLERMSAARTPGKLWILAARVNQPATLYRFSVAP